MRILPVVVLGLGLAAPVTALPADDGADADRPRIGLVLSGGGARGAAHAGVLKVLEENRIPIDYIAGTSFGALVGGLYASGLSPDEIIEWIREFDYQHAAADRPPRRALSFRRKQDDTSYALRLEFGFRDGEFVLPRGLISAQELGFALRVRALHSTRWRDFDDYPIPFRAVATDIERAQAVVLGDGSLADAMLASMAVPGVVAPVEIDGYLLVDGGLTNNLPVDVVRAMGADVVIVVDVATPLSNRDELDDVIGVSAQVINLLGQEQARAAIASLGNDDLLLQPDLGGIAAGDFELMGEAIDRGLAVGPGVVSRLRRLALDEPAWTAWRDTQRTPNDPLPDVDFIEIDNPTGVDDRLVRARMKLRPGSLLSLSRLRRDIDALYSVGEFSRINFELVERDAQHGLRISLTEKELGPNYLRFGLNIQDDFGGDSAYNLLFMHNRTRLNALNGEWRTEIQIGESRRVATEFFQPVTWRGDWFISPRVESTLGGFNAFDDDGNQVARYEVERDTASFEFGWQWRNLGQVAAGAFRESVHAQVAVGDPSFPSFDQPVSGWDWRIVVDQLDNWNFPADAWFLEIGGRDTADYAYAQFHTTTAWQPSDANRVLLSVRVSSKTAGALPVHERFGLGGFLSVSGLRQFELRGDYLFSTRLLWYRRLFSLPPGLGDGFYFGLSHERGNVWATRGEVSLDDLRWGSAAFLGADLVFGALYLGLGRADNGDTSGYLFLQRSFQ